MWRSFFFPRDSRDALSRNCIAAHWIVLWRRRLIRWIATGTKAAARNQARGFPDLALFEASETFRKWLASAKGQKVVGDFTVKGKKLFTPNAAKP